MSIQFQNLKIKFIKDIDSGNIEKLEDINLFVQNNCKDMVKPSEPRRLFRAGCRELNIDLQLAKTYIKANDDLVLLLQLQCGVNDIDKFLDDF